MSLKNAGKNVFEKEDGALEAFRRYLELDEKDVYKRQPGGRLR